MFAGLLFLSLFAAGSGSAAGYGDFGFRVQTRTPSRAINVSYFYENLSSDGQWFPDPNYGWCWTPYDVAEDWRPYSEGHWEYSDYGWSWASDESFGWATYHYGRWFFSDSYGWAWVPGTEWSPAWVAWRAGDDWMGWAPLPPTARWDDSSGLDYGYADAIPSNDWCFVPRQHVFDVNLTLQLTSVARNVTLIGRSRDATRYEIREGRPANIGFDVTQVEMSIGRQVPRMRIADADAPSRGRGQSIGNGSISFFRPPVQAGPATHVPTATTASRPNVMSDVDIQRQKDERGRRLEADLTAERARLARDQQTELNAQASAAVAEETRRRHVVEQQAFDAHAVQQRQVMEQRVQRQVVRPDNARGPAPPKAQDNNGNGNGNGKGNGKDKGKGHQKGGQ
jgi:hypothetical protein